MNKYKKVNINLIDFKKDYWEDVFKDYIKKVDNTETKIYIKHNFTKFMKTIKGIAEYKMNISRELGKYSIYLLAMIDSVKNDNLIDVMAFQESNEISDNQIQRMIYIYKKANVLKKSWYLFYMNPLIAFFWTEINWELWLMFEDELKKVWIDVKYK